MRGSDRRSNDWENFAIMSSDDERCEGGGGADEKERGARRGEAINEP